MFLLKNILFLGVKMGAIHSSLRKGLSDMFSVFKGKKRVSLAILGLDSCGKSTLVNLFNSNTLPTEPTLGFSFEEITFGNTTIMIWDMGGQKEYMSYWKRYVDGVDGLVFMIDIADEKRFKDAVEGFESIVPSLKDGLAVLFFLNKTDLLSDKSEVESRVKEIEKLYKIDNTRSGSESYMKANEKNFKVQIAPISVKTDLEKMDSDNTFTIQHSSVHSGFKWLIDDIKTGDSRR